MRLHLRIRWLINLNRFPCRHLLVGRKSVVRCESVSLVPTRDRRREEEVSEEDASAVRSASSSAVPAHGRQHPTFCCPVYRSYSRAPDMLCGGVVVRTGLTQAMLHKMAVAFIIE